MRTRLPVTLASLTLAATGALGALAPAAPAAPSVREQADRIMNLGYAEFARTPHVAPFNWTNDGCSVPTGYTPYRKVFEPACVQHDFGYRNYGALHELRLSPTRETRRWIDGRFRTEMRHICEDTYTTPLRLHGCLAAADAYHLAVRAGGGKAFY
ncbi:phospholipase A2 [Streptomyces sp. ODS28]|uniref:phospholipase A2 n=1 Tax=Streptomyces sp. ODS28 TaxID=3136688 RepID=UPI0031EDF19C